MLYPQIIHKTDAEPAKMDYAGGEKMLLKLAQNTVSPGKKQKSDKKKEKKPIDKEVKQPYSDVKGILPSLPDTQRQIVELLTEERLVDEIIEQTGLPAAKVSAALTVLEIKGHILSLPGGRYCVKK
jgi:predicted Rossmann fold nucleotide-binding protein DprA/Smf involved in DNA uptake